MGITISSRGEEVAYPRWLYVPPTANFGKVDPRLVDIVRAAAATFPYTVKVPLGGGANNRSSGTPTHPAGKAIDVEIYKDGKKLPNKRNAESFRLYEQFAQAARKIQQERYPELNDRLAWGGYYRQGVPFDQMHLDIGGARGAYGSWETGLNEAGRRDLPGAESVGLGGVAPRYRMTRSEAQNAVAQLGFTGASAIPQFQRAAGLKADNIVGPDTTNAIRNALSQGTTYSAQQGMAPAPISRDAAIGIASPQGPVIRQALPPVRPQSYQTSVPRIGPLTDPKYQATRSFENRAAQSWGNLQNARSGGLAPVAQDGSDIRTANSPLAASLPDQVTIPRLASRQPMPGPVSTLDTSVLSAVASVPQMVGPNLDNPPLPRVRPQIATGAPSPGGVYYDEPQATPQEQWKAVGALDPIKPVLGKPVAPGDQQALAKQDPWAATPKLMRPSFGMGLVGGMLANAVLPGSGILGRLAGREIGKHLPPTQVIPQTQQVGQGMDAISALQSGAVSLGPGQYLAARNVPNGYRVTWGTGPNGQPMQTAYTPSGRTYQTYSIGPSLSPMEVTVYGYGNTSSNGNPLQSRTPSANPTSNPSAGGVY